MYCRIGMDVGLVPVVNSLIQYFVGRLSWQTFIFRLHFAEFDSRDFDDSRHFKMSLHSTA